MKANDKFKYTNPFYKQIQKNRNYSRITIETTFTAKTQAATTKTENIEIKRKNATVKKSIPFE